METKNKGVMVYGFGNLGKSILEGLAEKGVKLFSASYNAPGEPNNSYTFNGQKVHVINSSLLEGGLETDGYDSLSEEVSFIVVTTPGNVLEKKIDFLLKLNIPLIICSTGYDQHSTAMKARDLGVSVLMSPNMALGIVDFWDRLTKIPQVPSGLKFDFSARESHQAGKKDISGSLLETMRLFLEKGLSVNFNSRAIEYDDSRNGSNGAISWLRQKLEQLQIGVPKRFIRGHGYHLYYLKFHDEENSDEAYLEKVYNILASLEEHTIPNIFEFKVIKIPAGIGIIHNINGRKIYSQGVHKSIQFLSNAPVGVYSGVDLI